MCPVTLKHPRPEFIIDGTRFTTLEGFYDEVGAQIFRGRAWGRNLDALADALDEMLSEYGHVTVYWNNSQKSRVDLGYLETARALRERLKYAHPDSRNEVAFELAQAEKGEGPTVFAWLVDMMGEREGLKLELL